MKQIFTYNHIAHLNAILNESELPFHLQLKDEKTIEIEQRGICACSGKESLVLKVVTEYFDQENIRIKISDDTTHIYLHKTIQVVAAIIRGDGKQRNEIFATQRGYGEFKGGWEFPGGKMEPGETKEAALIREIREELGVEIEIEQFLRTIEYDYESFHLIMHCYVCHVKNGTITLLEHEDAKWLTTDTLDSVAWLPADLELLEPIREIIKNNR